MRNPRALIVKVVSVAACALAVPFATPVSAQEMVEPDAATVLSAMSNYLGGLPSFTADYDVEIDVITPDAEKLQFGSSGELVVQRPDKFYASRKGAVADAEIFLDGKSLTIFGKKLNGFIQFPASSIDAAIDEARDSTGFDAPGADLLSSKPLDTAATDLVSGTHVGMAYVDGVSVHHLAFRGRQVDWQLWVTDGPQPLPVKYVITSKWLAGAPEYTLRLRDWNVAPEIDAARFTFVAPPGASQVTEISIDETGDLTAGEGRP